MTTSRTIRTAMLAFGNVLTALVGVVSLAVLVRVLPVESYATYRQVLLTYTFLIPLLTFGLPESLYYFLPAAGQSARTVLLNNVCSLAAIGIGLGALVALGGGALLARYFGNPGARRGLLIMAAYPAFMLPATALNACLVAQGK